MREMSVEELQQEVKKWKSKYQSQVGKMGAYKTKVQREVLDREQMVKWKEEELKEKEDFLKNTNIESLRIEKQKIDELRRKVEQNDDTNRKQLSDDFELIKQQIIDKLSEELIRWTEEYDIDNLGTAIDEIVSVTKPFYSTIHRIILYQLAEGKSCAQIAKYLNEHGYKSKQGKEWSRHTVHLRVEYIRQKIKDNWYFYYEDYDGKVNINKIKK